MVTIKYKIDKYTFEKNNPASNNELNDLSKFYINNFDSKKGQIEALKSKYYNIRAYFFVSDSPRGVATQACALA